MFTFIEEGGFGASAAAPVVRNVFEAIANDDIDTVPTEQQVEEFLRQFKADEIVELGLSGDPALDLVQGLDVNNLDPDALLSSGLGDETAPSASDPAVGGTAVGDAGAEGLTEDPTGTEPVAADPTTTEPVAAPSGEDSEVVANE